MPVHAITPESYYVPIFKEAIPHASDLTISRISSAFHNSFLAKLNQHFNNNPLNKNSLCHSLLLANSNNITLNFFNWPQENIILVIFHLLRKSSEICTILKNLFNDTKEEIQKEINQSLLVLWDAILKQNPDIFSQKFSNVTAKNIQKWLQDPQNQNVLSKITSLDLSNKNLKILPKEIGNFPQLTHLGLGHNQLSELPKEIGKLTKLTHLDLVYNQLTTLPKEIGTLSQLTHLGLGYNQLIKLPEEIGNLTQLTLFLCAGNSKLKLPEKIGNLSLNDISVSTSPITKRRCTRLTTNELF